MYGIIAKVQGFWRAENDFDWRMENLGVWGDGKVKLVTSDIDGGDRQGETG